MTNEAKRKDRIETIYRQVKACNDKGVACNREKLILAYQIDLGFSKRIVVEYLNLLISAERLEDKDGELWISQNPLI